MADLPAFDRSLNSEESTSLERSFPVYIKSLAPITQPIQLLQINHFLETVCLAAPFDQLADLFPQNFQRSR